MSNPDLLQVDLVTPSGHVLSEKAETITISSCEGDLGVMPGHAPLLTLVSACEIILQNKNGLKKFATIGGILEINNDHVTIAVDTAEAQQEINFDEAKSEYQRAVKSLQMATTDDEIAKAENLRRYAAAKIAITSSQCAD